MGCDIDVYVERKVNGKWESADKWDDEDPHYVSYEDKFYKGRNYDLFGMISKGVRRDFSNGLEAKGIPEDLSRKVRAAYVAWGSDAHSDSYISPSELKQLASMTLTDPEFAAVNEGGYYFNLFMKLHDKLIALGGEDQRMVFWFDN